MENQLPNFKNRKFVGVAELAEAASRVLEDSNSQQERGTVTEYPDERTVRYYLSEGLIPSSDEKQGSASVFHYIHLLALLAIKKLQTEHLSIKKIREIISGTTEKELEKILELSEAGSKKSKNAAQEYLETILLKQRPENEAPTAPRFSQALQSAALPAPNPKSTQHWERFELADGLELHVESNFKPPSDRNVLDRLIKVIEQIIKSSRHK